MVCLPPSAAGIACCVCQYIIVLQIFGQMVEEIAAAAKAKNHISTTLFSLGTKALSIVPENPTFYGMFTDSNSKQVVGQSPTKAKK